MTWTSLLIALFWLTKVCTQAAGAPAGGKGEGDILPIPGLITYRAL